MNKKLLLLACGLGILGACVAAETYRYEDDIWEMERGSIDVDTDTESVAFSGFSVKKKPLSPAQSPSIGKRDVVLYRDLNDNGELDEGEPKFIDVHASEPTNSFSVAGATVPAGPGKLTLDIKVWDTNGDPLWGTEETMETNGDN